MKNGPMARSPSGRSVPRTLRILVTLMLVCWMPGGAGAQNRQTIPTARDAGIVRLPVIEQQDVRFRRLSAADPLSPIGFTAIVEDDQGFIWLASRYGLNRYDGSRFRAFRHDPKRPHSLGGIYVTSLFKDRGGNLWVGSDQSLDRFDPNTESFIHYRLNPDPNVPAVGVIHMSQDRAGMLWLATENGLRRLDPATGRFSIYQHDPHDPFSLSSSYIWKSGEDKAGRFWVFTREGLDRFDRKTGKVTLRVPFPDPVGSGFYEDSRGAFWIYSAGNAPAILDRDTNRLNSYSFHEREAGKGARSGVTSMLEDRAGNLWFSTDGEGLFKLDRQRREFIHYRHNPGDPDSLPSDRVEVVLQDRQGNIWANTTQQGVTLFATEKPSFERLWQRDRRVDSPGPNTTLVTALVEDRHKNLWMGTDSALIQLDRETGRYTRYRSPADITAIMEDSSGTLWVGTQGLGLRRFNPLTGQFRALHDSPPDSATIYQLFIDHAGVVWVLTTNDLKRLDVVREHLTGVLSRVESGAGGPGAAAGFRAPVDVRPISLAEDRQGVLWLGTNDAGLYSFDPRTNQLTAYASNPADPLSLSNPRVNSTYVDRSGRIWIATQNGLDQLNTKTGKFAAYYERDGLAGNVVNCILEDERGDLWMSTNKGISRFDPQRRKFTNYTDADGLPGADLTGSPACTMSSSGEMIFGGFSGAAAFYPDKIVASIYVPPIVLTDFRLFGKHVEAGADSSLKKSITRATTLTFPHDQNNFSLEFAALDYSQAATIRYRYRMEGLEDQWNEVDSNERLVTYPGTPPGDYTFRVQVASPRGGWNEPGTELQVHILPPWWATWWFRSIGCLTLAGGLFATYRHRIRNLQVAGARLEAQIAERTRDLETARDAAERSNRAKSVFLANMSHELRTPLNAILGFSALARDDSGISEEHRNDLDIVRRSGEHLLGLIDDVLDMARIESGHTTLDPVSFNLSDLVADTEVVMRGRAGDKGLKLFANSSPTVPRYARADAGKLRQVLFNLVDNAIKYTERGSVSVRLDARPVGGAGSGDDSRRILLILEVEDTGIGIAPEDQARMFDVFVQVSEARVRKGSGLGLSIIRQFVHMMGGAIRVQSTPGEGSLFTVELPVELVEESEVAVAGRDDPDKVVGLAPGQPEYRILIVEDKRTNWLLLKRLLQDAGFLVRVAEDGDQAVDTFRTWQPALIWMDLRLHTMGGLEAAKRIREMDGGHEVRIVALTASAFVQEREEVLAAGFDDFIRKPYRREEIFDCMARQLGVRYLSKAASQPSHTDPVLAPTLEALALLPHQLRTELADVVVRLDPGPIAEVIGRVREHDAQLGEVLAGAAKRFAYTQILNAIQDSDDSVPADVHDRQL